MCVIFIAENVRPTERECRAAYEKNDDGAGVAWREGRGKETVVRFEKGLDEDQVVKLVAELPFPFIAHFRIQTSGGAIRRLTHPFEVSPESPLQMEGVTSKGVLFHNGVWTGWEQKLQQFALNSGGRFQIPDGKWNDSRGMAWLAGCIGYGILEFIGEKVVVMMPEKIKIYGSGWSWYGPTNAQFMVSNTHWTAGLAKQIKNETFEGRSGQTTVLGPAKQITSQKDFFPGIRQPGRSGGPRPALPFDLKTVTAEDLKALHDHQELSNRKFKRFLKIIQQRDVKRLLETGATQVQTH